MKLFRFCIVTIALLSSSAATAQAGLLDGMFGGSSKSCSCASDCQPECCKPVIVRPCNPNVYTYQRACSTIKPPCCDGCGGDSCCEPTCAAPEKSCLFDMGGLFGGDKCGSGCGDTCAPGCEAPCGNGGLCGNNVAPVCAAPCGNVGGGLCGNGNACAPACDAPCGNNGLCGNDSCGNGCAPTCAAPKKSCFDFGGLGGGLCGKKDGCAPDCAAPCGGNTCTDNCVCAPTCAAPKKSCFDFGGLGGGLCGKKDGCTPNCAAPCGDVCAPACDAPCGNNGLCGNPGRGGNGCGDNVCAPTCAAPKKSCFDFGGLGGGLCGKKDGCAPDCAAPCGPACGEDSCCETECCDYDPCELAKLIYQSQTACYADDREDAIHDLGDDYSCKCTPEIMHAFIYALNDADEGVRKKAADEIGDQIKEYGCCCVTPQLIQALTRALADCDRGVQRQAEEALEAAGYEIVDGCCDDGCTGCTQCSSQMAYGTPVMNNGVAAPVAPAAPVYDAAPVDGGVAPGDVPPAPPAPVDTTRRGQHKRGLVKLFTLRN